MNAKNRSGQAMVEFVITLLVVVVAVTGILQFVEIAAEREDQISEIRGRAGKQALQGEGFTDVADDIKDWEEGDDELRHTADDVMKRGNLSATLGRDILDQTAREETDWALLEPAVNDRIPRVRGSGAPAARLGLYHAKTRKEIDLFPATRDWLLKKETITVGADLWMPSLELEGFDD